MRGRRGESGRLGGGENGTEMGREIEEREGDEWGK